MEQLHFSIRTVLLVIISTLNLLIAAPLGYMTYQSIMSYINAQQIKHISETISYLYNTKKYVSQERAASLSIMYVPPSSFNDIDAQFRESRTQGDAMFEEARRLVHNNDPGIRQVIEKVQDSYVTLNILRAQMDVILASAEKRPNAQLNEQYFIQTTVLVKDLDDLIEVYSQPVISFNPDITRQMRMTHFIWQISEYAGREYAVLGRLIAQNQFPDAKTYANLLDWRTRIQYGLEIANSSVSSSRLRDELTPYLKEAETHYMMVFDQVKDLFNQPQESAATIYPITVQMWLQLASEAVNSLQSMTDAVLQANNKYVQKIESDARQAIILSLTLLMCALALSIYTWRLITRRVIRPVNMMVDALHREARLSNQAIPQNTTPDEIEKLSQVLQVFQENSRQLQIERDKAKAANVAKSEFLANMSHEIRTPMNVVVGLSNILSRSSPLTEKQQQFIKTLQISADSLLSLLNDLLDFSKIETHGLELEKIPFNFQKMIEEMSLIKSFKAKDKGLEFKTDISGIAGKEFVGDPTRIRQILTNLCGNAIKFTERGTVTLRVRSEPYLRTGYENIHVSVVDTGVGIAREKLDTIFEKFTQADATITRKYGGTGLGLAISKNLVEMMDGTIHVESAPGKGATFEVIFPLALRKQQKLFEIDDKSVKPEPEIRNGDIHKILLVEDYTPNAIVAGTFLEEFGYQYDVAANGNEAIQKFIEDNYDVVLMDVQMPGMDGFEATEAIRKFEIENKRKPAKIIGLTAHASTQDRDRCIAVGMDDYLSKPYQPAKLKEKIQG